MPGLVPGIHVLGAARRRTWMAGSSPAMTEKERTSPIAVVMPAVAVVVMPMPRPIAADLARPVIGPDHPAVPMWIGIITRGVVGGRWVEARTEEGRGGE